eukprot:CAMPEP_0119316972 /NCGR_PEP_ID=MMETSP1333-20130426/41527_1 /TAXON_ID=418940 /ORGANISM="Scyphosphaera apsteinii, Strain RCC1455" /LENGTH=132 /DNA_ID=CAMNT_0007322763 /DNA_START=34 /DNA_END=432 /DNA_ORIENTATION=-
MSLVQLELDEKDKESFNEMQQSLGQAQQELQMVAGKMRMREQEQRQAELTLLELQGMDTQTPAYYQVGKMFLQKPLTDLVTQFVDKMEACKKERAALKEKKDHVETAMNKVNDDFQEFIKDHLVTKEGGGGS